MKFLVSPTKESLARARPPVRLFLFFTALLLVALGASRAASGELTPAGVFEHYLGTGDVSERMPLTGLLEELHTGAFLYGFLVLMLGSLLVVSPVRDVARRVLTYGGALACVLDLASPFAVMRWSVAWVRVGSFVLAFGALLAMVVVLSREFARPGEGAE